MGTLTATISLTAITLTFPLVRDPDRAADRLFLLATPLEATRMGTAANLRAYLGPVPSFYVRQQRGTAPLEASFTDESRGRITGWTWDFGDGSRSTERHPVHVYRVPGVYTITLTVTGPDGTATERRDAWIVVR